MDCATFFFNKLTLFSFDMAELEKRDLRQEEVEVAN